MKKIFFLLLIAMAGMIETGCQSTNSQTSALPDNGMAPAAPVGSGTKDMR